MPFAPKTPVTDPNGKDTKATPVKITVPKSTTTAPKVTAAPAKPAVPEPVIGKEYFIKQKTPAHVDEGDHKNLVYTESTAKTKPPVYLAQGSRVKIIAHDNTAYVEVEIAGESTTHWVEKSSLSTVIEAAQTSETFRVAGDQKVNARSSPVLSTPDVSISHTDDLKIGEALSFNAVDYRHVYHNNGTSNVSLGWVSVYFLRVKPKDTASNFNFLTEAGSWGVVNGKVSDQAKKNIDDNRSKINDRTDASVYTNPTNEHVYHPLVSQYNKITKKTELVRSEGYSYGGKDASVSVNAQKGDSDIITQMQKAIAIEAKREGGLSSINSYDGEGFTWGMGFASGGELPGLLNYMMHTYSSGLKINYASLFKNVGVDVQNGILEVVDSSGNVLKGHDAGAFVKTNKPLISFFAEVAEKADYKQDVAQAQVDYILKKSTGVIPTWFEPNCTINGKAYKAKWSDNTVRLLFHLSHWLMGGSWHDAGMKYKDTDGSAAQILQTFIANAPLNYPNWTKYDGDVHLWESKYVLHDRLATFVGGIYAGDYDSLWPADKDLVLGSTAKNKLKNRVYIADEKGAPTDKYLANCTIILQGNKYKVIPLMGKTLQDCTLTEEAPKDKK